MSPLAIGTLYGGVTLLVLFAGVPIAFALGAVAIAFMLAFMPFSSLGIVAQNVYQEVANITLLTIPLFVLKGAAIGRSRAGADLYNALYVWMNRIPGGLGVANVVACMLFAAMAGSSAATCSAIGSAGIPELRRRGYSPGFAAGLIAAGGTLGILLPPSITMILYAVAAEQSLGRLFLAGLLPGLLLSGMFALYAVLRYQKEYRDAEHAGKEHPILRRDTYSIRDRITALPRILPFLILLIGVMGALYGGFASPGETAGLGAVLALVLIAAIYGARNIVDFQPLLFASVRESTMVIMIVGMSLLYSMVMSYLHISQGAAEWIVAQHFSPWLLLLAILLMVVVLGFFLPPASIILMTAPIILPPLRGAGFDLVWFGVVMTVVMEMGLIHPPVGLNLFVIKNIAPDIAFGDVMWGTLPFVAIMIAAVLLICAFPSIAMWLPTILMG